MANSVDPDQSDLDLVCLCRHLAKYPIIYGSKIAVFCACFN